uniref:Uncharacterized protein n=1 Tax=Caenorhabditis japonica TaxID=281687 RepID=A0A8R1E1K5_CAEJA
MLSLRSLIILFGLISIALTCAPHMPRQHGYCKFYVDGKSDLDSARKKRDSSGASGESGKSGGKRYNRSKKRKNTKCYEYEDGSKDDGAVLDKGVTYTITVTKS